MFNVFVCVVCDVIDVDFEVIYVIYVYYVYYSVVLFEEMLFDVVELCVCCDVVLNYGLLYFVVECDGCVVGYVYVMLYCMCSVYCFVIEDLIYIDDV